jgi:hypothetical protein
MRVYFEPESGSSKFYTPKKLLKSAENRPKRLQVPKCAPFRLQLHGFVPRTPFALHGRVIQV